MIPVLTQLTLHHDQVAIVVVRLVAPTVQAIEVMIVRVLYVNRLGNVRLEQTEATARAVTSKGSFVEQFNDGIFLQDVVVLLHYHNVIYMTMQAACITEPELLFGTKMMSQSVARTERHSWGTLGVQGVQASAHTSNSYRQPD